MKSIVLKHSRFIGQSLLWSLLLYITTILILDWEDVKRGYKDGVQAVHISTTEQPTTTKHINYTGNVSVLKAIWLHLIRSSHS
ncbi:MAG TPA: hypothetical protein VK167_00835 [Flavipsychrobacter sp.]|nr:hypothetical protein [Flavipsychrobacter sp.]